MFADFSFCSSGIQFTSNTPVSTYKVIELTFTLSCVNTATDEQTVNCAGMVVDCCKHPDCGSYKISLYFLDLPEPVRAKIVNSYC